MLIKHKLHLLLIGLLTFSFTVHADENQRERVKPKGNYNDETKCVKDIPDMRRNHMEYIIDQRDKTSREGVRTDQYSFSMCIDCHNAPEEDGKVAHFSEDNHFCTSCHSYVAVRIDCFSCHNSAPQDTEFRNPEFNKGADHSSIDQPMTDEQLTLKTINQMSVKEERQ